MIKPSFKIKTEKKEKNYARFIIEPLEQGYGDTLGNSLRRCLLTSIPGAAVTKVKIEGVKHSFSTLEGMKEDVVELVLNLKQIKVGYKKGKEEIKLTLEAKGPGEVKAKDIKTPGDIEIVNGDLLLAKLADKKSNLKMDLWVNSGYGYSLADEQKAEAIGLIPVDAIFSPIIRVNYKVESTRVGRRTDFDRLILEIWTDGTVEPKQALEQAAEILAGFFEQVYHPVVVEEKKEEKEEENNEILDLTVEELNLPTRIANALRKGGYPTVKALIEANKDDLVDVKNIGVKSIKIVNKKLKDKGVCLKK